MISKLIPVALALGLSATAASAATENDWARDHHMLRHHAVTVASANGQVDFGQCDQGYTAQTGGAPDHCPAPGLAITVYSAVQ
jgi:hypothetical protein